MGKYHVYRVDGRDNTGEQYIVIRIDKGAKNRSVNMKTAFYFVNELRKVNKKHADEIDSYLDRYKEKGE